MEYALSLGSNLGNRLEQLKAAKYAVLQLPKNSFCHQSSVYETAPVGVRDQYKDIAYLNAVLIINTDNSPESMLGSIHLIESQMGRIRTEDRFAPRPIDIDILYAGKTMSDCDDLTIPHPRWAERRLYQ
jgi:2-amino-4-hydroxy-6-hydroxymethyldihydropteridine diphosphokinase